MTHMRRGYLAFAVTLITACTGVAVDDAGEPLSDAGEPRDASMADAAVTDAGAPDAGGLDDAGVTTDAGDPLDAGADDGGAADAGLPDAAVDAGFPGDAGPSDAGRPDAGRSDAGLADGGRSDAGPSDAGAFDAGSADAGRADAGLPDAGRSDAGSGDAGRADAAVRDSGCVTAARGFFDFGVGAAVAESRGAIPFQAANNRAMVIAAANDVGTRPFIMVTDVDTGQTRQVYFPPGVVQRAPFGSMVSSAGRYYTSQGAVFTEYDPVSNAFTFVQDTVDGGSVDVLGYTEGPDGTIWFGGVYETRLLSFNPTTRVVTRHGRMDDTEEYLSTLATDGQGWVYAGIGTSAWNIVAYNPVTRERRNLIPAAQRQIGTASVFSAVNGQAVGIAGSTTWLLTNGTATVIANTAAPARRDVRAIGWGTTTGTFPDGRKLTAYDMPGQTLDIRQLDGGTTRLQFSYTTEGADLTTLGNGANPAQVFASSAHPMHFLRVDACRREMTDLGYIPAIAGGNMPAIGHQGPLTIGASYSTGQLWAYDDRQPFDADGAQSSFRVTQGLTLEAWVNVQTPTSTYGLIAARGTNTYFFGVQQNGRIALIIGNGSVDTTVVRGSSSVVGSWAHVAGTYDAATGTAKLYVNGVLDGTATGTPGLIGNKPSPLGIGSSISYNVNAYHLNGSLDELRLYDSALSASEIANHVAGQFNATGLKALWHFDETQGRFAADTSGYGNELALSAGTRWGPGRLGGALVLDGISGEGLTNHTNPSLLDTQTIDIARPRAVFAHPDGVNIGFSGFAGYGRCGGGISIYNLQTRQSQLLTAATDLLPGHSPIALAVLPNGDLMGSTSVGCPGGGVVTQTEAEIFSVNWATRRLAFRVRPVAGQTEIPGLTVAPSGLVYGLTNNSTFFVFNPGTRTVVYSQRWSTWGNVPMHAFVQSPTGQVYALMQRAIVQIDPTTYAATKVADAPVTIDSGGAMANGSFFFTHGSHIWSYTP